jgi:AcrR family transcriptional regulator
MTADNVERLLLSVRAHGRERRQRLDRADRELDRAIATIDAWIEQGAVTVDELNVRELARLAGCSPTTLYRRLPALTNTTEGRA